MDYLFCSLEHVEQSKDLALNTKRVEVGERFELAVSRLKGQQLMTHENIQKIIYQVKDKNYLKQNSTQAKTPIEEIR